ncbi:hypothetical protein BSL78_27349 [Apostichopus japonicus]|uniref:Uncharacterized protein n=1 Tax=Stichopus japonicus TaxID=307972 RepID=A0A2G8JJ95_STIJA|nr:hypothetical protein BSL78_27349 [Apostichopus japonicus]
MQTVMKRDTLLSNLAGPERSIAVSFVHCAVCIDRSCYVLTVHLCLITEVSKLCVYFLGSMVVSNTSVTPHLKLGQITGMRHFFVHQSSHPLTLSLYEFQVRSTWPGRGWVGMEKKTSLYGSIALTIGEKTCMRPSTPTIAEDEELQTNADETTSLLDQHHQKFDKKYTEDGFIIDNDDEAEFEFGNTQTLKNNRSTAENNRSTSENNRSTSENNRSTSENNCSTSENNRSTSENSRSTSENNRSTSEINRCSLWKDCKNNS